jgi:hypothetical protein
MKLIATVLAACLLPTLATAQAAGSGDNVLLLSVTGVRAPDTLPGECVVSGDVREVWDGTHYHVGQTITLAVPCGHVRPSIDDRPATRLIPPALRDLTVLKHSREAAVHIDDAGRLIWAASEPPHARLFVFGYMPLSGVIPPLG